MAKNDYSEGIKKIDEKLDKTFYGFSSVKDESRLSSIDNRIRSSLNKANSYSISGNNADVIEFLNDILYRSNGKNSLHAGPKSGQNFVDEVERGDVNLMFDDEKNRFQRYKSIDAICAMVPEIGRVVSMQRDMIMAPNGFYGSDFEFEILHVSKNDETTEAIQQNLKDIDTKYNISQELAPKINTDLVKYGDAFVVVLNFQKEINKLLNAQQAGIESDGYPAGNDNSADFSLASEDYKALSNYYKNYVDNVNKERANNKLSGRLEDKSYNVENWTKDVDDFLNIHYSENAASILGDDEVELYKELDETVGTEAENVKSRLSGSIVRHMEPCKVIKVEIGGVVVGYYYLDVIFSTNTPDSMSTDPYSCPACDLTYNNNRVYSFYSHMDTKGMAMNKRVQILTEIFSKRIGSKLNKKFIAKNTQFRDFIYTILKTNRSIERTNVIFMRPNEVIHFKRGSRTYGESILDPVLYFAKLYTLSLLSSIMQQVLQGKDKQVYYVETGLDEDSEGAVQQFIANLKQREITVDDFSDVTAIYNRVTKSNAMVIPVVDGKRAVEFDTFAGQEAAISSDFLEFLKKSTVSGTGYPSAWLDSSADVEFATTLVQQNANVLKLTAAYQKIANEGFTRLFKLIRDNEAQAATVNNADFLVKYPEPSSLDNTKTEADMAKVQGIADFIILTLLGEAPTEQDEKVKPLYKREIIKKLMSQLDWDDYEKMLNNCRQNTALAGLITDRDEAEKNSAQSGGGEAAGGETGGEAGGTENSGSNWQ